jgi:hypothetical protein
MEVPFNMHPAAEHTSKCPCALHVCPSTERRRKRELAKGDLHFANFEDSEVEELARPASLCAAQPGLRWPHTAGLLPS